MLVNGGGTLPLNGSGESLAHRDWTLNMVTLLMGVPYYLSDLLD